MPDSDSQETPDLQPLIETCGHCGADLDVTALEPLNKIACPHCGAVSIARLYLKNYRIDSVLGYGGMGTVYKAHDLNLNREVALKVINREYSKDPEHWKKFEEEARITALVNHPNVVKVYSFGSESGVMFIAMELADKGNLDDLMTLQGKIAEAQVLEVGIQIAEGLQAAHKCGLIHRDVKPGNILFTDAHTSKIVDFGLACLVEEAAEAKGEVWGTPYYVAPEKLNMEPEDFRSDIYSLGATLFHAIAGRPPHEAETASMVALKHIKSKAVSLQAFAPEVSSATAFVVNRMLQQNPAERYQTYEDLVEHLNYARDKLLNRIDKPFKPHPHVAVESKDEQSMIAWFVLLVLILMLCFGAGVYFFRDSIFSKEEQQQESVVPKKPGKTADGNINADFASARQILCRGDFGTAAKVFSELSTREHLPQPLGRWILLHQGMADLLARNNEQAKPAFKRLQEHGLYSMDPSDKSLANLFVDIGGLLSDDAIVKADFAKNCNPGDCQAIELFLCALHDWQLSDFEDAGALFQAFLDSNPADPFDWILEYKPIAEKYKSDFDSYRKISTMIAEAGNSKMKRAALDEIQELKNSLLLPGKLPQKLNKMEQALKQEVEKQKQQEEQNAAAEKQEQEQKAAAEKAADLAKQHELLAEAKTKYATLLEAQQYDEAAEAMQAVRVSLPELEAEKTAMVKKAQWLRTFMPTLMGDLSSVGFPGPVLKRTGATITGMVVKSTKTQIEVQTPYGKVAVPWQEVSHTSIIAMADYFAAKTAQPDAAADRWWVAGVYAFQYGLQREGLSLLKRAADKKAEYRQFLPMFGETAAPAPQP